VWLIPDTDSKEEAKNSPTNKKKRPTKKKTYDEQDEIPKLRDVEKALADGSYSCVIF
jgi:hypothetical protein